MRRNSRAATPDSRPRASSATEASVSLSSSSWASSKSSMLAMRSASSSRSVTTTFSRALRSWLSSSDFFRSLQMLGSSLRRTTSSRRCDFLSKSKKPPKVGQAGFDVLELRGEGVSFFGFHGSYCNCSFLRSATISSCSSGQPRKRLTPRR